MMNNALILAPYNDEYNNMNDKIKHRGIIVSIQESHAVVKITRTSACATCSVAGHCHSSDSKEMLVDVSIPSHAEDYHVGDTVDVYASGRMGFNAVMFAFGIPFIVMLIAIYLVYNITGGDEMTAVGGGIASLIVYYIVLYFLRDKLNDTFAFFIESISDKSLNKC